MPDVWSFTNYFRELSYRFKFKLGKKTCSVDELKMKYLNPKKYIPSHTQTTTRLRIASGNPITNQLVKVIGDSPRLFSLHNLQGKGFLKVMENIKLGNLEF